MGVPESKGFVAMAQEQGYVIAAPPWLKNNWIKDAKENEREIMENVLAAEPNLLFAKTEDGKPLCVAEFMRTGMGSYAYCQVADMPMIVLPWTKLDNPEMFGNNLVITGEGLGIEYTGQPNVIEQARNLDRRRLFRFNRKVYTKYGVPEGMSGLTFAGKVVVSSEMNRKLKEERKEKRREKWSRIPFAEVIFRSSTV